MGLFERSPVGMYRSRRDGTIVYANPAMARLLEYASVDELLAVNLARDVYVEPQSREQLIAQQDPHGVIDGEVRWRTRTGRELVVQLFGQVVHEPSGEISFDCSALDVTRERRQNAELARTARTLELVVEQVPAMYWLVDAELRIVTAGGATQRVLGVMPDRWVGHTLHDVYRTDPDSGDGGIQMHRRALAGETLTYVTEFRGKQLSTTVAPYRADGEIVGAIGTSIDVTTATMLERRMIDAQRAESLGVLAGGLAHDFNNLLVAILGNADLGLRDVKPGSPGRFALENVRNASLRAAELTDQLMAYAGRGTNLETSRVHPRAVLDELLQITATTLPSNVRIDVAVPSDLAIRGDAAQIRQVFMNLIGNAREAIGARGGRVTVTGRVLHHGGEPHVDDIITPPAGAYIQIEIADDGPGIDRERRRRIFEPFFTTKSSGHGLGLAAVLGIVRGHGGGLRVTSSEGEGARFSVSWPATFTPVQLTAVCEPTRKTVLVIDDEDLVRDVVARMIEDLGYAALTAADGILGLDIALRERVDAVLVDLTMPRMKGSEVVAALREKRPELPVILCTGFDLHRHGPVQAHAYLPKPFRIDALEQMLARVLGA